MKTINEIATTLIELCQRQQFVKAYQQLYSAEAISIDPMNREIVQLNGLDKLIESEEKFLAQAIVHGCTVSDPIISGNYFTVSILMDVTFEQKHLNIDELAVYQVKEGKIISQQFFVGEIKQIN